MKVSAEFKNGMCKLLIKPDDEWEQKLLGAVAKGGDSLSALIKYEPEGHFSYGKAKAVAIQLEAGELAPNDQVQP